MKRTTLIISLALFLMASYIATSQHIEMTQEQKTELLDSIKQNPSGHVFFIDGVETTEVVFHQKMFDNEVESSGYGWRGKQAILLFGERYRNGLSFFNSINSNDDEQNK